MNKSIAIIGKGPSVKRCNRDFVDSFDEVAICNRPVFEGYEQYIGNRAHWDFANGSAKPYPPHIQKMIGFPEFIPVGEHEDPSRRDFNLEWKEKFAPAGPSSGTVVFDWFLKKEEYTKIALIGFDLFPKGKLSYYFKRNEWNSNLEYLFHNGTVDPDGKLLIENSHNTELTYEYMCSMFDIHKDKTFYIITDYPFEEKDNLTIM
jgi:hypothetical protein